MSKLIYRKSNLTISQESQTERVNFNDREANIFNAEKVTNERTALTSQNIVEEILHVDLENVSPIVLFYKTYEVLTLHRNETLFILEHPVCHPCHHAISCFSAGMATYFTAIPSLDKVLLKFWSFIFTWASLVQV